MNHPCNVPDCPNQPRYAIEVRHEKETLAVVYTCEIHVAEFINSLTKNRAVVHVTEIE